MVQDYAYLDASLNSSHEYLLPAVVKILDHITSIAHSQKRIFELGCGNGSVANALSTRGFELTGVDPSIDGITQARVVFPHLKLNEGSAYDDLASIYGTFPIVLSLEVVEHVYYPRKFARTLFSLLEPNGWAIVSTPYHSYWKNLALALAGGLDRHFTALWDGGHIKFWSAKTICALMHEVGFSNIRVQRVGRIPPLAKSMICVMQRPPL